MLDDKDFIKSCDVPGPTKEAIRAILLYKSEEFFKNKNIKNIYLIYLFLSKMGKEFRGNNNRGRGNDRGGRGKRPKPNWDEPPKEVCYVGTVMHPVENYILVKNELKDKVPIFARPVYIKENKKIGMIDDVLGPINDFVRKKIFLIKTYI